MSIRRVLPVLLLAAVGWGLAWLLISDEGNTSGLFAAGLAPDQIRVLGGGATQFTMNAGTAARAIRLLRSRAISRAGRRCCASTSFKSAMWRTP